MDLGHASWADVPGDRFRNMQPDTSSMLHRFPRPTAHFPGSFGSNEMTDPFQAYFGSGVSATSPTQMPTYAGKGIPQGRIEDPVATACTSITDLVTKILITHPCTVLYRQCQVHQFAKSLHLTPLTLIPIICKIVSSEGILTLWKGVIGSGVLWGLSAAGEILIADIFGLPRHYVKYGSVGKFCQHLILKASTAFATTPFVVSAFIDTVRSESGLGDDFRVMDVVTNAINRLRFDFMGPKDNSKRFSLLYLSIPTACLFTSRYVITINICDMIYVLARRHVNRKPSDEKTVFDQYFPQIFANLTSEMLASLALYPLETVIHRLYIQGTRTLIDNLDNGVTAISITAKYNGFYDCLKTLVKRESFWALYAGAGALGLQYILHLCFLHLIRTVFEYGNRAAPMHQQMAPVVGGTINQRKTPVHFDTTLSAPNASQSFPADNIPSSATCFAPLVLLS